MIGLTMNEKQLQEEILVMEYTENIVENVYKRYNEARNDNTKIRKEAQRKFEDIIVESEEQPKHYTYMLQLHKRRKPSKEKI